MIQLELPGIERKPKVGDIVTKDNDYFGSIIIIESMTIIENNYAFSVQTFSSSGKYRLQKILLYNKYWNSNLSTWMI